MGHNSPTQKGVIVYFGYSGGNWKPVLIKYNAEFAVGLKRSSSVVRGYGECILCYRSGADIWLEDRKE